jgi:ankyrin repeat protein
MVIKFLIEEIIRAKGNLNVKDEDGYTALMWAKMYCHTDIVDLLKQHGAKE